MEGAARNPQFTIDLDQCRYSASYEGTQVLIAGELGFDALAKELSRLAQNPVMLLYRYDGDFWGYDFYGGTEEDHFSTIPDYFDSISQAEKERLAGKKSGRNGGCRSFWRSGERRTKDDMAEKPGGLGLKQAQSSRFQIDR